MKHTVTTRYVVASHREPILNAGIAEILRQCKGIKVYMAGNVRDHPPALVVTDAQSALGISVRAPLLIVDGWPKQRTLSTLLDAGIHNYVLQDSSISELHTAVRHLLNGGNYFSPCLFSLLLELQSISRPTQRETEVLALLAKGYCNKRIALHLGIQYDTVKTHMSSLMGKLGVASRTQALAVAVQRGMVQIETSQPPR